MIRETWALTVRELKHWYRARIQIFMTIIQPIVWLGLFGQAFNLGALFSTPGAPPGLFAATFAGAPDYFSFMSVGMLAVITLFTCMFSGMSIVWDKRFGFMTKLKVAPIPRGSIPLSRIMATVVRALVQASMVFIIALAFNFVPGLVGLTVSPLFDVLDLVGLFFVLFLLSLGFAALFTTIALAIDQQETLFAVINLLNLPLMFASAALFPTTFMPDWLKAIAGVNPLTLAVDAARTFVFHSPSPLYAAWVDILGLAIFSGIMLGISALVSRRILYK
jgi:ABC-2 type transport system permease protein